MEIPGYAIVRKIGEGTTATVYLALQRSPERQVVLKVLKESARVKPDMAARFLNEAQLVAALKHPNILAVHDAGRSGDALYIVLEFVAGGDLRQRMLRGTFSPQQALDIVARIGAGLAAVHDSGIVHRDVKPGNIFFRADGTPVLGDFGIAKRLGHEPDLTASGKFIGSPNYMAPEQSEHIIVDGRADIYALGVILYEMLSGRRAYVGDTVVDVIVQHKRAPIPELGRGHAKYQPLIERMMAKAREDRFPDVRALLDDIARLQRSDAPPDTIRAGAAQPRRLVRRILLCLLAVCLIGALLLWLARESSADRKPPMRLGRAPQAMTARAAQIDATGSTHGASRVALLTAKRAFAWPETARA